MARSWLATLEMCFQKVELPQQNVGQLDKTLSCEILHLIKIAQKPVATSSSPRWQGWLAPSGGSDREDDGGAEEEGNKLFKLNNE
jgi:hypothetical protein